MRKTVFGVDIGGTAIKIGMADENGSLIKKTSVPTRTEDGGSLILPDVADCIKKLLYDSGLAISDIKGIGVGIPGLVDETGIVSNAVNLGRHEPFDAGRELSGLLDGVRVRVTNDANAAALGEAYDGAGKGYKSIVMLTLGTGIGGGVICDGRIIFGHHGAAGEFGHICVNPNETVRCKCGRYGCLEQYASATGIVRLGNAASAKDIWDGVKQGSKADIKTAETFGRYLGYGLAVISGTIDPDAFIIGGGMSLAGDVLLSYVKKYFDAFVFSSCRDTDIVLAKLGNDAGMAGACRLILTGE